jgi:glutamyl/glutaminyl-tRNA synthetase
LKSFIKKPDVPAKLSKKERAALTDTFDFLKHAYHASTLGNSRLATDQTHFYSMATCLLNSDLLKQYSEDVLTKKLVRFSNLIEKTHDPHTFSTDPLEQAISKYRSLSTEKTTDAARRKDRQMEFIKAIDLL